MASSSGLFKSHRLSSTHHRLSVDSNASSKPIRTITDAGQSVIKCLYLAASSVASGVGEDSPRQIITFTV